MEEIKDRDMPISEVFLTDNMEYMKTIPDKFFELAIVDPPYGMGEDGRKTKGREGFVLQKNGSKRFLEAKNYKIGLYDDKPPDQSYFDKLFRISQRQIICGENYMIFNQKQTSTGRIVWDKVNGESDQSDCEIMWTNCIQSVRLFVYMWAGFKKAKSRMEPRTMNGNMHAVEQRIHPNHKPIEFYKDLLENYAKAGDKIFDSHMGSQSSRIAAYQMGFDYYGCELDPDYFRDGCKRFDAVIHKRDNQEYLPAKDGSGMLF